MQVKSIADTILLTFIKLPFVIKIFVMSILSGRLRQVLLYVIYQAIHKVSYKVWSVYVTMQPNLGFMVIIATVCPYGPCLITSQLGFFGNEVFSNKISCA